MYMVEDPARWNSSFATLESKVGDEMAFETQTLKCLNAQLTGWTDDATTKTYAFVFERPKGKTVFLDLGKVCHWATIKVNGEEPARFWREPNRLWCEPYRYDITEFLKDGENAVEVEVTSTIYNQLVLDAAKPEAERTTWTVCGPKADAPLADAGLYGPVTLKVTREDTK